MSEDVQKRRPYDRSGLVRAAVIARETALQQSPNSIRYATYGQNELAAGELERIVQAVPQHIASALTTKVYYFVPLAMDSGNRDFERSENGLFEETMISPVFTPELRDDAICHRNVLLHRNDGKPEGATLDDRTDGVFISTRLLNDRFALAFEFFINIGHAFVESVGVPEAFKKLLWEQALADVRGETSQDAWESRGQSIIQAGIGAGAPLRLHIDERARGEFLEAAFSDAVAIYLLSMSIDFNYSELREREYPLLAPQPLAERLRLASKLFPPNPGYEFAIRYRKRA